MPRPSLSAACTEARLKNFCTKRLFFSLYLPLSLCGGGDAEPGAYLLWRLPPSIPRLPGGKGCLRMG